MIYEEKVFKISFSAGRSLQLLTSEYIKEGYVPFAIMPINENRGSTTDYKYTYNHYTNQFWVTINSQYDEQDAELSIAVTWIKSD